MKIKYVNRAFDIFFSLLALMLFSLPALIISCLLRFKENHPILFRQERIGLQKKKFNILKFQTLVDGKPTSTGYFLRKTGLDEIPQFINVLLGDMSIVGPRALTNFDIERLGWHKDLYLRRWFVKPGITGFAQLYGGQNKKTSWFWDNKYLLRKNIFLDFAIIVLSFAMNVFGKTKVRRFLWPTKKLK